VREELALGSTRWRRVGGLRVVMSWPENSISGGPPPPPPSPTPRARVAGLLGTALVLGGLSAIGLAIASQVHAPQPAASAAGTTKPARRTPSLSRSVPVSVSIPAIGVRSQLLDLGLNTDGTIEVPSLTTDAGEAAWYKYSATPGEIGSSVIEGHVDNYAGPAVFFRLGALRPGDAIDVTLSDGVTAIFRVSGVREYPKTEFPDRLVYGPTDYAALRLITCGGEFDSATGHYLSSTVVFASLSSARRSGHSATAD
jgi:sortase (surface protein transpeptidase)